jgi:ABC-type lipoprotein export system ATPase subunit
MLRGRCLAGGAAIIATHSLPVANAATRVIKIADGRIIDDSGPR